MNEEQKKAFDRSGEQPDKIAAQPGQTETAEAYFEKEQEVVSIYYEAPPEDCEVIGVRFRSSNKIYFFDPDGVRYPENCHAVVETARGQEFGTVAQSNHIVPGKEIVLPLRKALRVATPEDERHQEENGRKAEEAFLIGNKKIAEHGLDMKLIDAEYTFDNTKLLFYFTSDTRVDFRDLVKDLASVFHCRIELRQIGIRDEAKVLGGLGICGKPFCCAQFLDEFQPVSIKMAKTQNLSLNPTKISGTCGRLMCCLKYEQEAYEDAVKRCPKQESFVETPDGVGTVSGVNLLREQVKVRLEDSQEPPKCYRNCEVCVVRSGKGKRPEGYVAPPPEELAKLRRAPEPEAAPEPTSSNPLAAALEAVFNGERPPEPEGERPRGEGEGRRRRRRGGRSEGASGGESRSQGEGQQRSRREWERRPEKPRDKEPGTAEAEGVQEGGERKPSRRRRSSRSASAPPSSDSASPKMPRKWA